MERVRQVTLAAAVAAAIGGCTSADRLTAHYHDARKAVGLEVDAARPATQLLIMMQRKLASLPDPVRPDAKQFGMPGQVFLIGSDNLPAVATGNVTLTVTDDTPRPAGQPPRTTEKWQFSPEVLARLRQKDERFGECYVLFLPWPAEWADVTRVTVKANYTPAAGVELHAQEVTINLDLGDNAVTDKWEPLGAAKATPPGQTPPPAVGGPPIPIQPQTPGSAPPALLPAPGSATPPAVPQTIVIPRS